MGITKRQFSMDFNRIFLPIKSLHLLNCACLSSYNEFTSMTFNCSLKSCQALPAEPKNDLALHNSFTLQSKNSSLPQFTAQKKWIDQQKQNNNENYSFFLCVWLNETWSELIHLMNHKNNAGLLVLL